MRPGYDASRYSATWRIVSSPSRSPSWKGPIGAVFDSVTAASIAAIESPCSSCIRQTSESAEFRTRLTTKPGTSAHVIGILRIACAKATAACRVSAAVSSPSTTSIRRMTDAGKK